MTEISGTTAARQDSPLRGALWMAATAVSFAGAVTVVRYASTELHPFELAFFRSLFATLFVLPLMVASSGPAVLRTKLMRLHVPRSFMMLAATLTWFTAVSLLPLGDAVALNFTIPMFTTMGAALLLGETVGWRRWLATAIGFAGVLVIVRPGFSAVSWTTLLPILAAIFMAAGTLLTKQVTRTESPDTAAVYQVSLMLPTALLFALFVWDWPSWTMLAFLMLLGLFSGLAHICLTRSLAAADASFVIPFDYLRLPVVAALAYLFFGEVPDPWTWVGAGIIVASAIYIARREAARAKALISPQPGP